MVTSDNHRKHFFWFDLIVLLFAVHSLSGTENRTRDGVRASPVQCRPPYHRKHFVLGWAHHISKASRVKALEPIGILSLFWAWRRTSAKKKCSPLQTKKPGAQPAIAFWRKANPGSQNFHKRCRRLKKLVWLIRWHKLKKCSGSTNGQKILTKFGFLLQKWFGHRPSKWSPGPNLLVERLSLAKEIRLADRRTKTRLHSKDTEIEQTRCLWS